MLDLALDTPAGRSDQAPFFTYGERMTDEIADECPICGAQFGLDQDGKVENSDLCLDCHKKRFFFDDEREVRYRREVNERIEMLVKLFSTDYNEILHKPMVEQMVRCEIAMLRYEQLIANDNEAPQTAELLKSERNHWTKVVDKLNLTIQKIRGDTKNVKLDFGSDFKKYLKTMLLECKDDQLNEEEKPSED